MTTETQTTPCRGALYLEFEKGPGVTQILIVPEGISTTAAVVPLTMFRRRITPAQPRKIWRQVASTTTSSVHRAKTTATGAPVTNSNIGEAMLAFALPLLDNLRRGDWKLRKEPIVVEVTGDDLEDARKGKTPYKIFGRVWKVRKALGFPKDFLPED